MVDPYRYFRVEADEILGQLQQGLLELEKGASSAETVASLLRLAHTLKGAARVVKQTRIADLSHALEDIFVPIRNAGSAVEPSAISKSLGCVDAMRAQLLLLAAPVTKTETTKVAPAPDRAPDEPFWAAKPNVEDLDVLMDGIGELNSQLGGIRRARRIFERARGVSDLLVEQFAPRRTGQAGDSGSAKLRALAEELQTTLGMAEREIIASVDLAGRELVQVRDAAERLRLVPAELMWGALERTARDAAVSLGKQVKFTAQGGDIRLDAEVLGLIQRALMQAVRNAVAHGVESPTERQAAGKLAEGQVLILVQRRDKDVVFSCRDDGRGLDLEAVRRGAERQGVAPAIAATMGAEALIQLLMRGGISTAHAVTGMSGRGIGLDLVRETAEKLGGRVHFESAAGRGTTVAVAVPASMSALSALLVEVTGQVVALPLSAVRGTSRQNAADVAHTPDGDTVLMEGQVVPYVQLARLLGAREAERAASASRSAVLMSAEAGLLALEVDRLLGVESIVVRALPELALLDSVVSGASLDADGNPRMVLGPEGLVKAARKLVAAPRPASSLRVPILVIDDSLTTRMLEQSILESAGYEVDLATSGEEGLEKARQSKYALFLVDVEMPGIDGFTFIAEIRKDPALKDIPAILVTSRASDQDRQRGVAVGAQAHIEKREFDQADLLQRIRKLVSWGMTKIRALVVEDSLTVRRRLVEVLSSDPAIEVVGEAENGQQAIEMCRALRPDVITLDMHLPVLDGVSATEHIMGHFPTPILIVSSSTNRGDLFKTYDALAAGAVDVLEKPTGEEDDGAWERKFLAAVKLVSRIRVITHVRARLGSVGRAALPRQDDAAIPPQKTNGQVCSVIAIGASTGGPAALVNVLGDMPNNLQATVFVVLHIDEPFSSAFAEWLGSQTSHSVVYAVGGEPLSSPTKGRVFMAPPGRHLIARAGRLVLNSEPERHSCRPSVDALFESLALECPSQTVACLLTGMGRDGASGLLALRRAGAQTIAQDEASSVIYGMPREAALLGAAQSILPLSEIGTTITRLATKVCSA